MRELCFFFGHLCLLNFGNIVVCSGGGFNVGFDMGEVFDSILHPENPLILVCHFWVFCC